MLELKDLVLTKGRWNSMTHPERLRHYSESVGKLRIVSGANVVIYSLFVAAISILLAKDGLEMIRGEQQHDPMILGAMALALALSGWSLRKTFKRFRLSERLLDELTKGLIPDSLRAQGIFRNA